MEPRPGEGAAGGTHSQLQRDCNELTIWPQGAKQKGRDTSGLVVENVVE